MQLRKGISSLGQFPGSVYRILFYIYTTQEALSGNPRGRNSTSLPVIKGTPRRNRWQSNILEFDSNSIDIEAILEVYILSLKTTRTSAIICMSRTLSLLSTRRNPHSSPCRRYPQRGFVTSKMGQLIPERAPLCHRFRPLKI